MNYNMINKYPDGSSYAQIDRYDPRLMVKHPSFTHRINSYEDLWHMLQIIDAFNALGLVPTVTIPCLFDAQADRRFDTHQSYGLALVLDAMKLRKAKYVIFHPHNEDIVQFALPDAHIVSNAAFFNAVAILENFRPKNTILLSPDAGGFKSLMKLADEVNWAGETYSASKYREWNDGESKLVQVIDRDDFGGKDVVVVDDLCVYGGTFKGLSKLLRKRNVGRLILVVSHMTIDDLGNDPVQNYFDAIYTTNSKYPKYYIGEAGMREHTVDVQVINMFK